MNHDILSTIKLQIFKSTCTRLKP